MKRMMGKTICYFFILFSFFSCVNNTSNNSVETDEYTGSASCIECHERFYKLWSTSHHGLAMQPITTDFIQDEVTLGQDPIELEGATYQAVQKDSLLIIRESKGDNTKDFEVLWALGGKNVYYFLTPWEGGRLQTLPLAYDVHKKMWYNNPESAIRHFPHMNGQEMQDEALSWRDRQYTFNTSCFACHVSQLKNNYDLATNTYETNWKEAGINCETCHGPSGEHVRVCREAGEGNVPKDLKLIITKTFTPEQHNSSCSGCHAKMHPITASYMPGDRFFDNYDLVTLENPDFYPDGRDLGENYTFTSWRMNECMQKSDLHCVTCHTSSGRYRFKSDNLEEANKACTTCHEKQGNNYEKHTHHPVSMTAPKCIECHMPKTRFGNMDRSDHSFRPPMPAASIKFGSPNACVLCHSNKTNEWANQKVTEWKGDKYQNETLYIGGLIKDARNSEWKRLDEMLEAIKSNKYGEVFTTSLIRLLNGCADARKWPVIIEAMKLESPLSRSSAARGLLGNNSAEAKDALFAAAQDDYRVVRLSAVQSLAALNMQSFSDEESAIFAKVDKEYRESLVTRPDDWSSYYNLGNHYQNMGDLPKAISSYENSLKIYPEAILPLVNSSLLYSVAGNSEKAKVNLEKALEVEPNNEAANLNYALLMAEMKQMDKSEAAFRKVLEINKDNTTAAYNLSIIVSSSNLKEACQLSRMAMEASPDDPKFAYTYAFFLNQSGQKKQAVDLLEKTIKKNPDHLSSVFLLGNIFMEGGNKKKVIDLYTEALKHIKGDQMAYQQLQMEIERLKAL